MIWLLLVVLTSSPALGATYYISPTGSNANNGTSQATPWLTFAYAINAARATCGDTLMLADGTYGDGASTGKIQVSGVVCTLGNELTITALNQRRAKINDNGSGRAVSVLNSAYIIIDGLYARSADNSGSTSGTPFFTSHSNHITLRNLVGRNPNRFVNVHVIAIENSQDVLLEDSEAYVFHRHCVEAWQSQRVVVRRQYCNPRGGRIAGGYNASAGLGGADALVTMYPCRDCIQENTIADGTTNKMYLNEMNATFGAGVLMSGSKVLGSICYKCDYGNGIYINGRTIADLNHAPQNNTVRDVAIVDWNSNANGLRVSDGVNILLDHITLLSTGGGANGVVAEDTANGSTPTTNSITMTNMLIAGLTTGTGFRVSNYNTWSGDKLFSVGNGTAFNPALPANWTTTSTAAHGMGTCKVWIPAGAAVKGAGTGGSDIGATILYRYVNGVLTTTPLWDQTTGAFPHGADDLDGTNNVAGQSLKDFYARVNVNTGGCAFPDDYGGGGGGGGPTNPSNRHATTDLDGPHTITIDATADKAMTAAVMVRHDGLNASHAIDLESSCGGGESFLPLTDPIFTPAGDRSLVLFGLQSPTPGTCTLTSQLGGAGSGANVSGYVIVSADENNVGSYGVPTTNASLTTTPSITVATAADETVIDFVGTSSSPTLSAGPDQELTTDKVHSTKSLRGASSTQSGADGGVMSHTLGGGVGVVHAGISLIPPSPDPPSSATLRLSAWQGFALFGPANGSVPLASQDTQIELGVQGSARLRTRIIAEGGTTTEFGLALYCKLNSGSYNRITNTFGSNKIRLYGPSTHRDIPQSGTATTELLGEPGESFIAGKVYRNDALPYIVPSLPEETATEPEFHVVQGNGLIPGDAHTCEVRKDDGTQLNPGGPDDGYTVRPSILTIGGRGAFGWGG